MARQLSTALSDGILSLVSLHAALQMLGLSLSAFVSFVIIGVAATFGTVRFSLKTPSVDLISYHHYLSWLATIIGMPYLASAYHRQLNSVFLGNAHLATGFALMLTQRYLSDKRKQMATEIVSGLAIVSLIIINTINFNAYAIIGGVGYILAGLFVKTDGTMAGIRRVDIFHYVLVVSNIAFMTGLQKQHSH